MDLEGQVEPYRQGEGCTICAKPEVEQQLVRGDCSKALCAVQKAMAQGLSAFSSQEWQGTIEFTLFKNSSILKKHILNIKKNTAIIILSFSHFSFHFS